MKNKVGFFLVIVGVLLIMLAPYFPDALFRSILLYDYRYHTIRFNEVIPSIRLGGIIVSVCGFVLLLKKGER